MRAYQVRDRTGIDNIIAIHDKGIGRKTTLYGSHSSWNGLRGLRNGCMLGRDGSFSDWRGPVRSQSFFHRLRKRPRYRCFHGQALASSRSGKNDRDVIKRSYRKLVAERDNVAVTVRATSERGIPHVTQ